MSDAYANAGVDQSNVAEQDGRPFALLLPRDPDGSAEAIRTARRMRAVSRQNLGWALAYNLAAVPLAATLTFETLT